MSAHSSKASVTLFQIALLWTVILHKDQLMDSNNLACLGPCTALSGRFKTVLLVLDMDTTSKRIYDKTQLDSSVFLRQNCSFFVGYLFLGSKSQTRCCTWACQSLKCREWSIFLLYVTAELDFASCLTVTENTGWYCSVWKTSARVWLEHLTSSTPLCLPDKPETLLSSVL